MPLREVPLEYREALLPWEGPGNLWAPGAVVEISGSLAAAAMNSTRFPFPTLITWSFSVLLVVPVHTLAADGIAITGGTVITMTDAGVLRDQTILVKGDTILSLGPSGSTVVPAAFDRVDATGKFVLPGLVDMHVHLSGRADLLANLRYGVTSVLQMSGQRGQIADFRLLRDQLERGELPGPRLFLTGPMFDRLGLTSQGSAYAVQDEGQIPEILRAHTAAAYDFVKVHNFTPPGVYRTLIESSSLPVIGHIPMRVPLDEVLSSKQAMFAHASLFYYKLFFDPSCTDGFWQCMANVQPDMSVLDGLVERIAESGATVTANLSILAAERSNDDDWNAVLENKEFALLDPAMRARWRVDNPLNRELREERRKDVDNQVEFVHQLVARLNARGVPLLAGTDAGVEGLYPGRALHLELRELVAAGLTEADALKAATATPGWFIDKYVPRSRDLGRIQPGYVADLVLLHADPLEDIGNTLRLHGTMSRGIWYSRDSLSRAGGEPPD